MLPASCRHDRYLDGIDNPVNLKSILLSGNNIEDISPLIELKMPEYADLIENKVDISLVNKLLESEVDVDY
jgi:Leucine-rich repeat (LRR) protein